MIVASVVSHGQNELAAPLISRLLDLSQVSRVILTCNIPDPLTVQSHPRLSILYNEAAKGFGANHNAAFQQARKLEPGSEYFCVLNPDLRIDVDPFPELLKHFARPDVSLVAPQIKSPTGQVEDSARVFPTALGLLAKLFGISKGIYPVNDEGLPFEPDWVAGMFMLTRVDDFHAVEGFDEGFYLYYEDVDICARMRSFGKVILADPAVSVVHDARRQSRRDFFYFRRHIYSLFRFLVLKRLSRL